MPGKSLCSQTHLRRDYQSLARLSDQRPYLKRGAPLSFQRWKIFFVTVFAEPGRRRPVAAPVSANQRIKLARRQEFDTDWRDRPGHDLGELKAHERFGD